MGFKAQNLIQANPIICLVLDLNHWPKKGTFIFQLTKVEHVFLENQQMTFLLKLRGRGHGSVPKWPKLKIGVQGKNLSTIRH